MSRPRQRGGSRPPRPPQSPPHPATRPAGRRGTPTTPRRAVAFVAAALLAATAAAQRTFDYGTSSRSSGRGFARNGTLTIYHVNVTRTRGLSGPGSSTTTTESATTTCTMQRLRVRSGGASDFRFDHSAALLGNPTLMGVFQTAGLHPSRLPLTLDAAFGPGMRFTGLTNRDEVHAKINSLLVGMTLDLSRGLREAYPEGTDTVERILAGLQPLLTPEAIERSAVADILPYMAGYGWTLAPGRPQTVQANIPSPFGGPPLPGTVTARLADDPATPDLIEYTLTQSLDPAAAAQFFEDFARAANLPADQLDALRATAATASFDDVTTYAYDVNTGLIVSAVLARPIAAGPGQPTSIERIEWRVEP